MHNAPITPLCDLVSAYRVVTLTVPGEHGGHVAGAHQAVASPRTARLPRILPRIDHRPGLGPALRRPDARGPTRGRREATRCAIPKTRLPASAPTRAPQGGAAWRCPRGRTTAPPLAEPAHPFCREGRGCTTPLSRDPPWPRLGQARHAPHPSGQGQTIRPQSRQETLDTDSFRQFHRRLRALSRHAGILNRHKPVFDTALGSLA